MGSFTKWLGAGLGFSLGGPIGAVIGFAIGQFVGGFSEQDLTKEQQTYQRRRKTGGGFEQTQSGDFEICLLVLASIVIKADGKVDQRELNFVRIQFVNMYGKQRANNAFKLFNGIIKKEVSARQICIQIRQNMSHASRLQLLHFLFGIAKSDQQVVRAELEEIKKIAGYLYVNPQDYESIKAMFFDATGNAYRILEVSQSATNEEVKKAYRKMVKKHHPDKIQGLGEVHLKGANEKFQSIQSAYEAIKNERGM